MSMPEHDESVPATRSGVLGRDDLLSRLEGDRPLLSGWHDLDAQLQPNGVDLSLASVARLEGSGVLAADNAGRRLPEATPMAFDADGYVDLEPGTYQVVFNETVDIPTDLMALGRPRSSLCRSGVALHTAVWDAGYRGRSTALLVVANLAGFRVQRDARLLQLVFFTLATPVVAGYQGVYQGENIETTLRAHR